MGDFEIIETGFDCADETINFGTRAIGVDTLYEISTVACLKSEEKTDNVTVNAEIKNGKLIIGTNKSLKIFDDIEEFSSLSFNMSFDTIICNVATSHCGKYMVSCLANGLVMIFDIQQPTEPIFSERLFEESDEKNSRYVKCFQEDFDARMSFIIVVSFGSFHRITIDENKSETDPGEKPAPICVLQKIDRDEIVTSSVLLFPFLVTDGSDFCVYDLENDISLLDAPMKFKRMVPFGHYALGLTMEGHIFKICVSTLIMVHVEYDCLIEDVTTIEHQQKKQILFYTKRNEEGISFLQLVNSDFTKIFSLKVSDSVFLIQLEKTTDDILFLSKIRSANSITELRIQHVYETQPELRLTKLIRKQQFQEAEKFAEMFKIDPVIILKAKAQLIIDNTYCTTEDIDNLITLFDSINDDDFILNCCTQVQHDCVNLKDVRKILMYGVRIIPKTNDSKYWKNVISDMLFRFDTYMALSGELDVSSYCTFMTADLMEEVILFLKNYQIDDAIIVYNRLDAETVSKSLTDANIEEILRVLNNLPSSTSEPFLNTFVPVTMMHKPAALSLFVKWLHNRIFQLEKRDSSNFPDNGIMMAESILKLMRVDSNSTISFQRYRALNKEGIDELAELMKGLRMLRQLKTEYNVIISLAEYLQGPESLVKYLLNIIMPPEDYENFVKSFLYTYLVRNGFCPDELFFKQINEFIKYDDCWVYVIEILLKYISSVETKLKAVKEILNKMPVPWNDVIKKIAKEAIQYSHSLSLQIRNMLEDEPRLVVLRNPKYKVFDKNFTDMNEFTRIVERIIYVNEPQFLEDVYRMCRSLPEKHEANITLFKRFVLKGNIDEAFAVLDKTTEEEIYKCAKWHFRYCEIVLNSKYMPKDVKNRFYKALYPLYRRLMNICKDQIEKEMIEKMYQLGRAVYKINKKFGRAVVTRDLQRKKEKLELFEEISEEVANNIMQGSLDIDEIWNICLELSICFLMEPDHILVKLCDRIGNFNIFLKAAKHLYENESDSKNLCLISVLFLKYLASQNTSRQGESFNTSSDGLISFVVDEMKNGEDKSETAMYLEGLHFCREIATKALLSAKEDEILEVYEVINWVNTSFYLTRPENGIQSDLYKTIYTPDSCIPSCNTFYAIKESFEICTAFVGSHSQPRFKYLTYFNEPNTTMSEEQLLQRLSTLPSDIDTMCKEGQHLTAFKLLGTIRSTLSLVLNEDSSVVKFINTVMMKKCLPALIHIVASAKYVDISFLYNLLLMCGKDYLKYVQYYMQKYRKLPKKLHDLSVLGIKLLDVHNNKENGSRDVMVNSVIGCKWWNKLKIGNQIQYETFFKTNASARLSQLINLDVLDVNMIQEYCTDFKINSDVNNSDAYYKEYLRCCLLNWKPNYECKIDLNGNKKIVMKNNEKDLHAKVSEAIRYIKEKKDVVSLLEKIISVVNFYHYEVFICIFNILKNNYDVPQSRTGDLQILAFLQDYIRYSPPSQREKEEWYTTFPDSQTLDPLSEYRLPFTKLLFTSDIWSIIRPEINLKSYKRWFDVTNVLQKNLKKDEICVYAIKQLVSSGLLGDNTSKDWILYPKLEDLIKEVDECAQNISDLESATSVVYHLMYHTPNGADKVNAARLSYDYASKYRRQQTNSLDVEKAYIKVKNKYYGFSAMHILHKFNLNDEKYVQLVSHPQTLVENLYMDERILKQAESVTLSCPDINAAVDALSKLFQLNIENIRYNLLNTWLGCYDTGIDLDATMVFPVSVPKITNASDDSDSNLKRAIYLCNSCNPEFWIPYLVKVALNEDRNDNEQSTHLFKSKALKCLCAITDEETIVKLTKVSYTALLNYIDKLTLLSQLECLGIYLNIETLDQYNKKDLLKRLSQIGKNIATKVMGAVCITYSMVENRYWEFIINSSIKFGMINDLKTYVHFLKNKCDRSYYVRAWQEIIDHSFQHIPTEECDTIEELFVNNFLMIQSSPVLFALNFEKIIKQCIIRNKLEYAAILLQYLPEEKKEEYVCDISKSKNLLLDLDKLDKKGIWGVRNVKKWLRKVNLRQ